MPKYLPEMIELLITGGRTPSDRNFIKVMDQFVQRIPIIHATTKPEFFIAYFLGGIYNFQYTQLKNKLGVIASFWKYDGDSQTLDLVFKINDQKNKKNHWVFRSITICNDNGSPYAEKVVGERPYNSVAFKDVMLAELNYKNEDHIGGLKFTEKFYQTPFTALPNSDTSAQVQNKLTDFGFENIPFESNIQGISKTSIEGFSSNEEKVKTSLKAYLEGSVELFSKNKDLFSSRVSNDLIRKEAFSHGFLYGSLSLNFKNQYRIDAYVERVAGNGYADLVMISRVNANAIPILIELKAGTATVRDAVAQIKKIGYFQHEPSLRTYHPNGVIAGVNFNSGSIVVDKMPIASENNIIERIVTISNSLSSPHIKQQEIQKNLMHLYYSRLGGLNFRSFVSLLVGYVLSFERVNNLQDVSKHLFLPFEGNNNLDHQAALLAIDFKDQGVKKTVVFALSAKRGPKTRSRVAVPDHAIVTALNFLCTEGQKNQQSEVQKVSIRIDETKMATDFFASIHVETIDLTSFKEVTTISQLKGELHELKTLTFTDFFQPRFRSEREFIFSSDVNDKLKVALFPLRGLFQGSLDGQQKEFSFQAMMQGITAGLKKDSFELRTFAEPNYSAQGRADLVITLASFDAQKKLLAERVFVFEFKALVSSHKLQVNAAFALQQAKKYTENLKSLSNAKEAMVMGLVMNSYATSEDSFLIEDSAIATVDHFSTDEQMSSPERSPNKRKYHDRDESSEEEGPAKRRCRRSVGTSCQLDFSGQDNEELMSELAEARKKGPVILLADSYALLLGLLKGENSAGKIVILNESVENLTRVAEIVALASQSATVETWLEEVQRIFPKAANILVRGIDKLGDRIDFTEFKALLARGDLVLAKMNAFSTTPPNLNRFRQHLGIENERIAAIYLGDYEYRTLGGEDSASRFLKREAFKTQILSLLASDESVDLYRRTSPNDHVITFYSGTKSYLAQEWQAADLASLSSDRQEEVLLSLKVVEQWDRSMGQAALLSRDWIPILATAQETVSGNEQMHFIDPETQDVHIVALNGHASSVLREDLNLLYERMAEAVPAEVGMSESLSDAAMSAESVDGLNAAFTVQAVFDFMKQKDRAQFQTERGPLYTALQIHHYLNLAQMAHGTVMDVNKVVNIVKDLLREEVSLGEKSLSSFRLGLKQGASEGLGILFGAASVVLDSVELNAAKTEAEKATFGTQLAFDTGGLSLSLASMGAAYAGAAGTAAALGAGTVILSGLGIGINALVQAFSQVTQRAQAVGSYFSQLDAAYKQRGYQEKKFSARNQSVMNPLYGAVVTEIDFINETICYGSPYLYRARHGGFGSGRINYMIWSGTTPVVVRDKQQAINIRERLAYAEKSTLGNWKTVSTWILPDTPTVYIHYGWMILPGATSRNDRGFSVLRKLEEKGDFDYDFYVFPSEFIIDSIREERVATHIKIILDERTRTLVVPRFSEKDRDIYQNLHYEIIAPAIQGRCPIILNRIGSLSLNSQHPQYTWELVTADSIDTLEFTATGIKIGNTTAPIHIHVPSPRTGIYLLLDKKHSVFTIDWDSKKLLPIKFDFTAFKNNPHTLQPYLRDRTSNASIIVEHFPLQNDQGVTYNGTAYYLPREAHYVYTSGIPNNMGINSYLVGCLVDSCYFSYLPDLLWRSNSQTHQLEEKYLLYSDRLSHLANDERSRLAGKAQIESAAVEMDGSVKIHQVFNNEQGQTLQSAHYHLVQGKLVLSAVADDELLQILMGIEDETRLIAYLEVIFNQKANLSSGWDDYPQLSAKTIGAEINSLVAIAPLTENATFNLVWLRKQAKDRYQVINPHVAEKQLFFLGSLLAANGSEVFYFLRAAQASTPAQLFRQSEEMVVAAPVDLQITYAYYAQGMLFILTPENIIKKLNVLGETSIVSFNAEWMRSNQHDWWEKIPSLLVAENHPVKEPITLYGLSDLSGNALGAWYDPGRQSFVLMQAPTKPNGEQFRVTYLGRVAELDFFFSDNGILYQQASCSDSMSRYFQATQLQKTLPALVAVADSLQSAYFHKQRLYLHQNGLIFSLDPHLPQTWCLEKVEKRWFEDEQQDQSFLANKTRFLQGLQSKLMANYESDFFSTNAPFTAIDFSNRTRPLVTTRKNAMISIESAEDESLWWNPHENTFFYNAFQQDSSDWRYLGVCSGKNDAQGVCFFSPKAKMMYFNPDYRHEQANHTKAYWLEQKFPAELAISYKTVFLLLLNNPADSAEYFIPLLHDQKNLNLCISSQAGYTFEVSKKVMEHYQVTFYQFNSLFWKKQIFLLEENLQCQKNGQDIILSSVSVSGQWTFLQGMVDEAWHRTRFDVSYDDGNKSLDFLLTRIRSYLLSRNELNVELSENYFSSYSAYYAHQGLHRHEVEIPNFSETRIALPSKAQSVSAGLISSSLSLLAVLASGISYILIRRFRQNRLLTLAERGVVAVPLLPLLSQSNVVANSVVDCHRHDFFTPGQCLINQSSIGLLGYCHNGREALLWFKNTNISTDTAELLGYALWQHQDPSALNVTSNWQATRVTTSSDYLYLDPQDACRQAIDLQEIKPISMSQMFSYLPKEAKLWLQSKWAHEASVQAQALQDAAANFRAKQLAGQIGLNYLASEFLLHTKAGDCFQQVGLQPNWQAQDHRYYVARILSAGWQLLWGDPFPSNRISTMAAVGLETALLHPKLQAGYFGLSSNSRYTKQVLRFLADLLQFGVYNFAYLPSALELLFSDYAPVQTIVLGLRALLSLVAINNDPSYYYLGIALFLLPQLPLLLEHLGIPVTRYVSQTLEKLTQFFIFQSLISQFTRTPDSERLAEQKRALDVAQQRVTQGQQRLSRGVKPVITFFKPTTRHDSDAQASITLSARIQPV
ncbi:MAG: TcdA/TcdB pore-forming domain-containing protein [Candidatus Aquirickettsiella gammari]